LSTRLSYVSSLARPATRIRRCAENQTFRRRWIKQCARSLIISSSASCSPHTGRSRFLQESGSRHIA
jgi:hypothetical protein